MDKLNSKIYFFINLSTICLAILILVLVSVWTSYYLGGFSSSKDPLHYFNYHPLLAVLGLVLNGEGLLLFRSFHYKTKPVLKYLHTIVMFIIFILFVMSLKCVFDSHNKRKVPIANMYSLHSWIGLGTVILFSVQFASSFLSFLYPGIHSIYRRALIPYHRFIGITIFSLNVLSSHSGIMEKVKASLQEKYLELPPAAFVANFLGVSIAIYAILIIYLVSNPQFKRIPLPEENKLHLEMHDSIA